MRKSIIIILSLSIILILSSCLPNRNVHIEQLKVNKGMSSENFKKTGLKISKELKGDVLKNSKLNNPVVIVVETELDYFDHYHYYLFEDNKLIFWGYPHQFLSHKNIEIRKLNPIIGKEL